MGRDDFAGRYRKSSHGGSDDITSQGNDVQGGSLRPLGHGVGGSQKDPTAVGIAVDQLIEKLSGVFEVKGPGLAKFEIPFSSQAVLEFGDD